jgi:hypothetical protein
MTQMNVGTPEDKIKNDDLQPFTHTNDCTPEIKIQNKYDLQSFAHTNGGTPELFQFSF